MQLGTTSRHRDPGKRATTRYRAGCTCSRISWPVPSARSSSALPASRGGIRTGGAGRGGAVSQAGASCDDRVHKVRSNNELLTRDRCLMSTCPLPQLLHLRGPCSCRRSSASSGCWQRTPHSADRCVLITLSTAGLLADGWDVSARGQQALDTDLERHHGGRIEAGSPRRLIRCVQLLLDGLQPAAQPVHAFLRAR